MKKLTRVLSILLSIVVLCFIFTACVPSSVDEAVTKMQEKGYNVDIIDEDYFLTDGAIIGFKAYNVEEGEGLMAFWFNSSSEAKDFVENWIDDMYPVKKSSGKCAYAGTEKAVKDFRK